MPQQNMVWDDVQKEGNSTKSQEILSLIKEIERHEVRGTGVASAACHPVEWDEYIMLLLAVWLLFSQWEKLMYMILAVMMLQRHFISRINNIMCLAMTTIQQTPPVLPSTENVQVQKYQIQARHANTFFLRQWIHLYALF
jgi:hypothetical protein